MPPKKRTQASTRRPSKRLRSTELTETEAVSSLPLPASGNSPNSNTMMVDVQALSATISVAVSQAVQKALEQVPQAVQPTEKAPEPEVEAAVEEDVSSLTVQGTALGLATTPFPMPSSKQPFSSIAIALGSRVSPKIKAKIWANEYIDLGALLSLSPNQDRYSISLSQAPTSSTQPKLTLEPCQPSKKIHSFNQWLSAFNTFVAIYAVKSPNETPKLMKYCEIIRDLSVKPGDWYFYDEQFRYIRQSAPDLYPWDIVHWELWLKAVLNFRAKSYLPSEKVSAGVFSRSRSRPSFPKGTCWTFHAGRYCSGCRFEHVCFKCGSKHPASQCSANQHQQRSALPKNGAVTSNSTQQAGHARKGGQA